MKLINASIHQTPTMMQIVQHAQHYLASLGIDQWQNGYPNEKVLINDINNNESYLVLDEEHQIQAIAMFTTRTEPTYANINGNWLTESTATYGVIHRMAVRNTSRSTGLAQFIFRQFEQKLKEYNINSMRIDTHQDNKGMQRLLNKLGYVYCGIIYLEDGNKRLAFEKKIP